MLHSSQHHIIWQGLNMGKSKLEVLDLNPHSQATGTSTTIGREGTPSRLFRQLGSGGSLQPRRVWHGTHNRSLGVNSMSSFFAWQLSTEVSSLQLKISGTFLNRKEIPQITIIFTFNTVLSCGPHWRISCLVWPLQTINLLLIVAQWSPNPQYSWLTHLRASRRTPSTSLGSFQYLYSWRSEKWAKKTCYDLGQLY